jgi:hypothetical protein
MSIITVRCRLVAGIKQQINKKSIKNFSDEERALLQKPLDDNIQANLENPKNKEKIFLAKSSEHVRQNLWQLFLTSSALIDELFDRLSKHENFRTWRQQGELPDDELESCWLDLKNSPIYDKNMPAKFFYSVRSMVENIYASWLALNQTKQLRLDGLNRLTEIVYSDEDLLEMCDCQFEQLQAKAESILAEIDKKISDSEKSRSRINLLFKKYPELPEVDLLGRSAIAYLIRHGCKVESKIEPTAKFKKWFGKKRKEARRLEKQLAGHFPRGRDIQDRVLTSCLETTNRNDFTDNLEYLLWCNSIARKSSSLPHPVKFDSNTYLRWLKLYRRQYKCKQTASGESIESIELTQRLFVELSGLTRGYNYVFEVYCDGRQIEIFQQFLNDDRLLRNADSKGKYSSSLFTLRSAHLLWERKESQDRHRHDTLPIETADEPWNTNQLYLHCAIETKSLTAEGMSEIQQRKIQEVSNTIAKQLNNHNLNLNQQKKLKDNQTSLTLLDRPLPRPSIPKYQGNPQIIVGLIFEPAKPIYLAVVDVTTGKTIICRSTRQLLGDKYPQLSKYRLKQQQNSHHRRKKNKQRQFHQPTESTQGEYLDRLLAKAVIQVAQEFNASSIALPPVNNKIEKIQSELEAYAEEEIPEDIGTQKKLTGKTSVVIHKWSYNRLSGYIKSNAAKLDLNVETGSLQSFGTPAEQATAIAISAYNSRKHSKRRSTSI